MSENMVANGEHEKISIGRVLVSGSTPLLREQNHEGEGREDGWAVTSLGSLFSLVRSRGHIAGHI
jgi:hypothetical protein